MIELVRDEELTRQELTERAKSILRSMDRDYERVVKILDKLKEIEKE